MSPTAANPEVVTLGESMVLLVTDPAHPLRTARSFTRSLAGAESNVAIGLSRLGHTTGWAGRVGGDAFGLGILDVLRREGVDVSRAVIDPDAPTGVLVRDRHQERRIQVLYYRAGSAGSRLQPDDVDPDYLGAAKIVHLTGITPALSASCHAAVTRALQVARDRGVTVSFDPNLRLKLWSPAQAVAALTPMIGLADLILVGLDEGETLSGRNGREAVATWFLEQGARLVVVKLGRQGAWATDGARSWSAAPRVVAQVDAVGAGDAFVAGFLSEWLAQADVDRCLTVANAVGAMSVQVPGDVEGLPYRDDLDAFLQAGSDVDR